MIVVKAEPLYNFLQYCNKSGLEKKVLDCGAGGDVPPLILFHQAGYETHGIDNSDERLQWSKGFTNEYKTELGIIKGDMREIPFEDASFSFVYSYMSIYHLELEDIFKAMAEMRRILREKGLCFVNFLTTDDPLCGTGKTSHGFYTVEDSDAFVKGFKMLYKAGRKIEKFKQDRVIKMVYTDYIVEKS
ncbi:MAG: class I SAM-dependent methyltransferase [bacterium]|nr:class I SAM-dependent methyltransferase [bacterium]